MSGVLILVFWFCGTVDSTNVGLASRVSENHVSRLVGRARRERRLGSGFGSKMEVAQKDRTPKEH